MPTADACVFCGLPMRDGSVGDRSFRQCLPCGYLRFAHGGESSLLERYESGYSTDSGHEGPRVWQSRLPIYCAFLQRAESYRRLGRCLDVGCGYGHFLLEARARGWEAWGIEPLQAARNSLAHDLKERVLSEPLSRAELPADFDIVTFWNSLDFVYDPARELKAARRALRPGGLLFLRLPNPHYHLPAHHLGTRFPRLHHYLCPVLHARAFYPKPLLAALRRLGFRHLRLEVACPSAGDPYGKGIDAVAKGKQAFYALTRLLSPWWLLSPSYQVWARR